METVLSIGYKSNKKIKNGNYSFEDSQIFNDIINEIKGKDFINNIIDVYQKEKGKTLKFIR